MGFLCLFGISNTIEKLLVLYVMYRTKRQHMFSLVSGKWKKIKASCCYDFCRAVLKDK